MLNSIHLVGRRADENQLMFFEKTNKPYLNFTIAVPRNFKNKEGEYETDFLNVIAFGTTAEYVERHLKKGKLVAIEGRLQNNNYQKDGKKFYTLQIIVESVSILQFEKKDQDFVELEEGYDFQEDLPF